MPRRMLLVGEGAIVPPCAGVGRVCAQGVPGDAAAWRPRSPL